MRDQSRLRAAFRRGQISKVVAWWVIAIVFMAAWPIEVHQSAVAGGSGCGGPGDCSFCLCESDVGCSDVPRTGCSSTTFTAPCNGTYTLQAKVVCTDGNCQYCDATVDVYPAGQPDQILLNCHNHDCALGSCKCAGTVNLCGGTNYTLEVCLNACYNSDCSHCGSNCKAIGCLTLRWMMECMPL